jgi:hypothetical protein
VVSVRANGFLNAASWIAGVARLLDWVEVKGGRVLGRRLLALRVGTFAFLGRGRRDRRGMAEAFAAIDGREEASSMAADQILLLREGVSHEDCTQQRQEIGGVESGERPLPLPLPDPDP